MDRTSFNAVKGVFVTDRFAYNREVVGFARGHGRKDPFHSIKRRFAGHQVCNFTFWNDQHGVLHKS